MNEPKLERCPFCGMELDTGRNVHLKSVKRHPYNPDCPLSNAQWLDKPGFYERWNRRTQPDIKSLTVERLRTAMEKGE